MVQQGNEQRLMRLGAIEEKKRSLAVLEIQIERLAKDIGLALFMDSGVESINLTDAKVHFADLDNKMQKWSAIKDELKRLENV
jgi:hypothetical protein